MHNLKAGVLFEHTFLNEKFNLAYRSNGERSWHHAEHCGYFLGAGDPTLNDPPNARGWF